MPVLDGIRRLGFGRTESVDDYLGVLIPLEDAHLYSHATRSEKSAQRGALDEDEMGPVKDGDNERQGMLELSETEYTIENLRREMRRGAGEWTDYESE